MRGLTVCAQDHVFTPSGGKGKSFRFFDPPRAAAEGLQPRCCRAPPEVPNPTQMTSFRLKYGFYGAFCQRISRVLNARLFLGPDFLSRTNLRRQAECLQSLENCQKIPPKQQEIRILSFLLFFCACRPVLGRLKAIGTQHRFRANQKSGPGKRGTIEYTLCPTHKQ